MWILMHACMKFVIDPERNMQTRNHILSRLPQCYNNPLLPPTNHTIPASRSLHYIHPSNTHPLAQSKRSSSTLRPPPPSQQPHNSSHPHHPKPASETGSDRSSATLNPGKLLKSHSCFSSVSSATTGRTETPTILRKRSCRIVNRTSRDLVESCGGTVVKISAQVSVSIPTGGGWGKTPIHVSL